MTEGDSAAVDIDPGRIELKFGNDGEALGGEGLVVWVVPRRTSRSPVDGHCGTGDGTGPASAKTCRRSGDRFLLQELAGWLGRQNVAAKDIGLTHVVSLGLIGGILRVNFA